MNESSRDSASSAGSSALHGAVRYARRNGRGDRGVPWALVEHGLWPASARSPAPASLPKTPHCGGVPYL